LNKNIVTYNLDYLGLVAAAGGTDNPIYVINEVGRRFNLNSINLTLIFYEAATGKPLPAYINQFVHWTCYLYNYPDINGWVGRQANLISGGGSYAPQLGIYETGYFKFNSMPFFEQFELRHMFTNTAAATNYNFLLSEIVEIEFIDVQ
jgi:hypothetical protein